MAGSKVFLQSRHARIASLTIWILTAIGDVCYVATHLRSLDLIKWLTAIFYLFSATMFIRLAMKSSGRADE